MARLNDDGQWIVLMAFLISASFFFLAIVLNQSIIVGQTTAEGVLEFPKSDIRDFRAVVIEVVDAGWANESVGSTSDIENATELKKDITILSLNRKNAVVDYNAFIETANQSVLLHYSNGVTTFNEIRNP